MKNPDSKPLRIHVTNPSLSNLSETGTGMKKKDRQVLIAYGDMLAKLAIAESNLAKTKDSSMPHFIAIVKELERIYGFEFRIKGE